MFSVGMLRSQCDRLLTIYSKCTTTYFGQEPPTKETNLNRSHFGHQTQNEAQYPDSKLTLNQRGNMTSKQR